MFLMCAYADTGDKKRISVTTWPNQTNKKCQELIERLTITVHEVTGAPLDKIVVYIQEIPQTRWGERAFLALIRDFLS